MDLIDLLGPISRVICLMTLCAWLPLLGILYLQHRFRTPQPQPSQPERHNGSTA